MTVGRLGTGKKDSGGQTSTNSRRLAAACGELGRCDLMGSFEVLDGPFVLFSFFLRAEGTQISRLAGFGIFLPGIQPVFSGFEFANHAGYSCKPHAIVTASRVVGLPSCIVKGGAL